MLRGPSSNLLASGIAARRQPGGSNCVLPLGVMTSGDPWHSQAVCIAICCWADDTDRLTRELLDGNDYFGMPSELSELLHAVITVAMACAEDQLSVFKQGKVPALLVQLVCLCNVRVLIMVAGQRRAFRAGR
jgi:hypothetical protein